MKKIICAVMMLGLTLDASAMEKQQSSASEEERNISFARLKTVEPVLVDNVNSVLKTLSEQGNIWLFGKKIPLKCGTLRNILNKEITKAKRTIGMLDFLGKAELSDIKPGIESQVSKIREQWGVVCSTPISDEENSKISTAIRALIDAANTLADTIETTGIGEKKAPVIVSGKDDSSDDETEQSAEEIACGVNDLTLSDSESEDESSEEEQEENQQGGMCNVM